MKISGNSIYLLPFAEKNFNDQYVSWLGDYDVKYLGRRYFSQLQKKRYINMYKKCGIVT